MSIRQISGRETQGKPNKKRIALLFKSNYINGQINTSYCNVKNIALTCGSGNIRGNMFTAESGINGCIRLEITIVDTRLEPGSKSSRITVLENKSPFTFYIRDINMKEPVYIPEYGVIVTEAADKRDYCDIEAYISSLGQVSDHGRFNAEPEETYEAACIRNRIQYCPTVLGIGRDIRMFRLGLTAGNSYFGSISACYNTQNTKTIRFAENKDGAPGSYEYELEFHTGPGASSRVMIKRELDGGVLPILRAIQYEDDIEYRLTAFASLEKRPLSETAVRGSDWLVSYSLTNGSVLEDKEKEYISGIFEDETIKREEEIICCIRIDAVNTGCTSRYAFIKPPCSRQWSKFPDNYDNNAGFTVLGDGNAISINRINCKPMEEEMSVLLRPGETARFEFLVPHSPVSYSRATALADIDFDAHYEACREFWMGKLKKAACISVPEKSINERISAGLLHLDLAIYGKNEAGPLLASLGRYAPIGSESSPIIQFLDVMGLHDIAECCLDFFIEKQRENGRIWSYSTYEVETGPWLWTMGEHFRYTRNLSWLKRVAPAICKGCRYLLEWRERNKKDEYRETGCYGLIEGQVADPKDRQHAYMLNAYAHLGLKRAAEILGEVDPVYAEKLQEEVKQYREDIRNSFYSSLGRAPVVPSGDGTWAPYVSPCAENPGGLALYAEGGKCQSHNTFLCRDLMLGCDYLVIGEVLEPYETGVDFILDAYQQPFIKDNSVPSQPYYSRHVFAHAVRDEVKLFLKAYYNQMTGLQDRETYTFWEHYYGGGLHKTPEEAFFLMQTRLMLYMEENGILKLLRMIPRLWLKDGSEIRLEGVKSYFGTLDLYVKSMLSKNRSICALIKCRGRNLPKTVTIKLPHPKGIEALNVKGGIYDLRSETVIIDGFTGEAEVTACY